MLYTKYKSSRPCSFRQEYLKKNALWESIFTLWPTYVTNWNRLNTLVGDQQGIIPVKFCLNPVSGFREEVVWMK